MLRSNAETLTQHSRKKMMEREGTEKESMPSNWDICKVPRKYFRWALQHLHLNISHAQRCFVSVLISAKPTDSHTHTHTHIRLDSFFFCFSFHYFNLSWFKHRSRKIIKNIFKSKFEQFDTRHPTSTPSHPHPTYKNILNKIVHMRCENSVILIELCAHTVQYSADCVSKVKRQNKASPFITKRAKRLTNERNNDKMDEKKKITNSPSEWTKSRKLMLSIDKSFGFPEMTFDMKCWCRLPSLPSPSTPSLSHTNTHTQHHSPLSLLLLFDAFELFFDCWYWCVLLLVCMDGVTSHKMYLPFYYL